MGTVEHGIHFGDREHGRPAMRVLCELHRFLALFSLLCVLHAPNRKGGVFFSSASYLLRHSLARLCCLCGTVLELIVLECAAANVVIIVNALKSNMLTFQSQELCRNEPSFNQNRTRRQAAGTLNHISGGHRMMSFLDTFAFDFIRRSMRRIHSLKHMHTLACVHKSGTAATTILRTTNLSTH